MSNSINTIQSPRILTTNYGERAFTIGLTTGWQYSPFELYMNSDGSNSSDRTRIHLAINTDAPESLELAGNAMQVTYPSTAKLVESCRINVAEGETENGSIDVSRTVERRIARLVLADMNRRHDFRFNGLEANTITNLLFLAIRHEPSKSSEDMHKKIKNLARNPILV